MMLLFKGGFKTEKLETGEVLEYWNYPQLVNYSVWNKCSLVLQQ